MYILLSCNLGEQEVLGPVDIDDEVVVSEFFLSSYFLVDHLLEGGVATTIVFNNFEGVLATLRSGDRPDLPESSLSDDGVHMVGDSFDLDLLFEQHLYL